MQNIQNGVREGTSVYLNYFTLSVESIKAAVIEALENPQYFKNAQRRSRLFRDQPEKPIDRAMFWIEWVMRHADEYSVIQLPIRDLGVIVSHSFDVIGFLVIIFVVIAATVLCCAKKMFKRRDLSIEVKRLKPKKH